MTDLKEKIKNLYKNFTLKTIIVTIFSLLITFLFAIFNGYLGLIYGDTFGIGISIYYLLLVVVKTRSLLVEKSLISKDIQEKVQKRKINYLISSIFMFIIDVCLIAPIIIMVLNPKQVSFGIIPAITFATYTTYKLVFSIINYKKANRTKNLTITLLKELDIVDALVSILSLQHILIMVNGWMTSELRRLSLVSSLAILLVIIIFSILIFIKNFQSKKENKF